MASRTTRAALVGGLILAVLAGGTREATPQTIVLSGPVGITADDLRSELSRVEMSPDLDEESRAKAVERYKSALRELARIDEIAKAEAGFRDDAATAAERAAQFQAQRAGLVKAPIERFDRLTLTELDAERAAREARLAILKKELKEVEAERKRRADRKAEIRKTQAEADSRRAELQRQIDAPPPENAPPALTEARRLEARLRLEAFEKSLPLLDLELAAYAAEEAVDLLRHREEWAAAQLAREEAAARRLTDLAGRRRQDEAKRQLEEAERQKLLAHPLLKPLAEKNRQAAKEAADFPSKIQAVEESIRRKRLEIERQEANFRDIQQKEREIGLTRPIGVKLREQRSAFPDLGKLEQELETRQDVIDEVRLVSWDYADELTSLPDARSYVRDASPDSALPADQRLELERMAADLLATRRELLSELKRSSEQYFNALFSLDVIDRRYLRESREYLHYINERILWTRSADPLSIGLVRDDAKSRAWLLSPANWRSVLAALAADPVEHPFAFWPTLVTVLALFYVRLSIRPRLRALGGNAGKRGFLRYGPTAQAAVLTVMSAVTAPAALLFVSWRLAEADDPTGFVRAVAAALEACAAALLPVELLRESCRHLGLAEAHFAWPSRAVGHLRRVLSWMKTAGQPVMFLAVLSHHYLPLSGGTPTERLLFIGGMALAAVTLHRLLSGRGELALAFLAEQPKSLFTRFRRLWYAVAVAVPVVLAGLSALGYHYSATQVAFRLLWTLWLAAGLVIVRAMAVRWVVLSRRRLLLDQAYQRRAAEEAQDAGGAPKPPVVEETDVAKTTAQTRKLVDIVVLGFAATFLGMIWADTLPAIGLLDRPMWSVERDGPPAAVPALTAPVKTGTPGGAAAAPAADPTDGTLVSVTTLDLAVAILLALFTFLASRNLPGLMEMSVLNRLPVDNATRYAATRLASYAIVIVGVLMASNRLGLRWQNVQWLAAALTVGLGFGLQEVFANFVSGLIILFERPVRVGDIVTIDDVTGVVSRIRMRATTITNWDRKEFIVPNKEFITGRVLNWTLSDAVNRITVNVGIAYGSDVQKAREILLRICDENPLLLKDPAPAATFEGFGDSTLNLVLRCFLPSLDNRLDVVHDLHTRIDAEFRAAGIEIAFPQRDLHVRSIQGLTLPFPVAASGPAVARPSIERAAG